MLKFILENWGERMWNGFIWLRTGSSFGRCEDGDETSVLIKSTAVPLQAWSGPESSRKLRFPDFMTTAQDGGKFVSLTHRPPLPLRNTPGTHFC